jgi:mannose-1-phosphate guanylyltransferase
MKALLLSAGVGSRLRPVTDYIPKCLVPINGKVLLEYWLENLTNAGISEFIINTHYMYEAVEEYISTSQYKDRVTLVYEEKLLNTGGTLLENRALLKDEPFMLVHADNLSFCDYGAFIQAHKDANMIMTMMLFETDTPSSCGIVKLDERGIVQEFHEKVKNPPSNLANAAVYIFQPEIFSLLEEIQKPFLDISLDLLPSLMGKTNTYLNDVYHRDIGTLESYALAQIEIRDVN